MFHIFWVIFGDFLHKGKTVPLQAWSGPEGSRTLRFPDYLTTTQESYKFVNLRYEPLFTPGNTPGTLFC